ncbi:MAG: CRTAC1 family protein [Gemmatimonadota bacterium]
MAYVELSRVSRLLLVALLPAVGCQAAGHDTQPLPAWVADRTREERTLAEKSPAFHDFAFADRVRESGITFVNQIVDDAGRDYKAVHYDHGTGICTGDVDGDGLSDLYFVTQRGSSELWRNQGGGTFSNITDAAGLRSNDAIGVGCAFADIDNDGRPDLFVTTVRHGNHLYHNVGGGKFAETTAAAGVQFSGHSSGAVFFDYDGDGLLDLFVANVGTYTTEDLGPGGYYIGLRDAFHGHTFPDRAEASILYHNLGGGKFADVTQESELVDFSWSGDAVVLDANNDGRPDLYLLDMQGQNHLWLNKDGKTFRDATDTYFPKTPWGAMGAKVFDYNGDGQLDLYVTDMHSDMFKDIKVGEWAGEAQKSDPNLMPADLFPDRHVHSMFGNALFANRGSGKGDNTYEEVSDAAGVETYWPWGPSADDLNADGWDDLFVANSMNFPFRYAVNSVLLNESGKHFLPSEFIVGVEPRAAGATEQPWFTIDCNGADKSHLYCGYCKGPEAQAKGCHDEGSDKYTIMGARGTRSSLLLDLDGDGDLDIVTNEFNAAPQILISDLSTKKKINVIKVRLRGTRSNRQGLGAQVTVVLPDGRRILKGMDGKSGYLSLSDGPLYFGLGDATRAASIEVRWPSGKSQSIAGPAANGSVIEIVEP